MAAGGDERAADEGGVGEAVEAGELAQAVEEDGGRLAGLGERGAAHRPRRAGGDERRHPVPPLRVARGEEEERPPGADRGVGVEDRLLLPGHRRAGEEHRPPAGERTQPRFELGVDGGGRGLELQVPGHGDPFRRHAEGEEAVAVGRGLHPEPVDGAEERPEEGPQPPEAGEGAIAHPAVDHDHRQPAAAGGAEDERPVIPLHEDERPRREPVVEAGDRQPEIEREVGDRAAVAERRAGPLLAGGGDGGHEQRQRGRQMPGEGRGHAGLAHRDRVEPERPRRRRRQAAAEAGGEGGQVMPAAPDEEDRSGGEEGGAVERLVEEPHGDGAEYNERPKGLQSVELRPAGGTRGPAWTPAPRRP
ncbi:MAG: hypothetical protein BWX64_02321 [Acidobacteria bacterium ADurb.Bin051]|nr:MAG: hypothetical protein BWX64_02321 [Acidobacteria bacterium ADurb.Bin051]